ncbi:TonB-dependent Receptor Plug Domain [Raineya orbicola]|uniref:TonB-dependent Receptor Plug Domain n=1 Tax=Raineya orbicola TaxID=2016530 RepID=A0A2N3IH32_9BACT|nr:TonB-dependent Receptor Plug Domain [Raineya orbicola]
MIEKYLSFLFSYCLSNFLLAQTGTLQGFVKDDLNRQAIVGAMVKLEKTNFSTITDSTGFFLIENVPIGEYTLRVQGVGILPIAKKIVINDGRNESLLLFAISENISEIVVSGTLRETETTQSPILVEVYSENFLQKNPTSNFADALQYINGVRPQITCSVCGTLGIQINGMEAPYTMVLIDGMPMVSGLGTVYGFSGIPTSLIKRVEVVKGTASTLYGSEAVAGLINIITKSPQQAEKLSADVFATSHQEYNADIAFTQKIGKFSTLLSANVFGFNSKRDVNADNFTDIPLQKRFSIFNKWQVERKDKKNTSIAWRYIYENRLGGEISFSESLRGSNQIYGESIFTKRFELLGRYDLPTSEKLSLQYSFNHHLQDAFYGNTPYQAIQSIAFAQMLWEKKLDNRNHLLAGSAFRYTFYDDNSPATATADGNSNQPSKIYLPSIFLQNETEFNPKNSLLIGLRYDYNSAHGNIFTPRLAYKFTANEDNILRFNIGKGFRIVNLFTEDHTALTGARQVVIANQLKPEESWNVSLSYEKTLLAGKNLLTWENNLFYTYFTNRILPNYEIDDNLIIYDNLQGYSVVRGWGSNLNFQSPQGLRWNLGCTLLQSFVQEQERRNQVLVSPFSATWSVSYTFAKIRTTLDWTGNLYSPMPLVQVENDFRPEKSPWYSIQNLQITTSVKEKWQIYAGVKNLLNFMPQNPLFNPQNPFSDSFDTAYGFAPLQGIRGFLGVRWHLH